MRLPGRAWLEMRIRRGDDAVASLGDKPTVAVASLGDKPTVASTAVYCQRAVFLPRGLAGHAYWAAVWPFHSVVFGGMARNIARAAAARPSPQALIS
jgi:hypothetical protein